MTKGQLMQQCFTEQELWNVDPNIPQEEFERLRAEGENTAFYVMDYNDGSVFGELVDMREKLKEKKGVVV